MATTKTFMLKCCGSMLSTFTVCFFSSKWFFIVWLAELKWQNPPISLNFRVCKALFKYGQYGGETVWVTRPISCSQHYG